MDIFRKDFPMFAVFPLVVHCKMRQLQNLYATHAHFIRQSKQENFVSFSIIVVVVVAASQMLVVNNFLITIYGSIIVMSISQNSKENSSL